MSESVSDRSVWQGFAASYARALQGAGAPTPFVEEEVGRVLAARGIEGTVMATPTMLWVDVDGSRVVRVSPAEVHLARQAELVAIGDEVAAGLDPEVAQARISAVASSPDPWWPVLRPLAWGTASAGVAIGLGGSANDVVAAGALGSAVSMLHEALLLRPAWARLAAGVVAMAAAMGAQGLAGLGADPLRTALAAVVILAPGMGLTTAAAEVAEGHWASGTARLSGALATLVQLGVGLAAGAAVVSPATALIATIPAPPALWLASLVVPAAIALLGRSRPADVPLAVIVAHLAVGAAHLFPGPAGALAGSAVASALGSLAGRARHVPAAVFHTPALFLLVPGGLGVSGLRRAIEGQGSTLDTGWAVGSVVVALVAGTMLGHAVVAGSGFDPGQPRWWRRAHARA